MTGFDCQFVANPPEVLQTHCPLCLLILCEPYQVTCCGKSFCKDCITKIKARSQPCPTCKQDKFEIFPNKGLQLPLYGLVVFCSNKERGCVWEGKLEQLDQHINSNPDKEKQLVGCGHENIVCSLCDGLHPRHEMERHQTSLCPNRPFTCSMCEEYKSTYEDVLNCHTPVCKCRPMECPNSCGADNLQHQHLEEHLSSDCRLAYVKCNFSDLGCGAKVYRKDLVSHLSSNLVTHLSLVTSENRKLKLQLEKQEEKAAVEIRNLEAQLELEAKERSKLEGVIENLKLQPKKKDRKGFPDSLISAFPMPPIELECPASHYENSSWWTSPLLACSAGFVEVRVNFARKKLHDIFVVGLDDTDYSALKVTIILKNLAKGSNDWKFHREIVKGVPSARAHHVMDPKEFMRNNIFLFHITDISRV